MVYNLAKGSACVQMSFHYGTISVFRDVCNLHSVVKKGIEGDLWGCLWVRLGPCDIQDECFAVVKVSYLLYIVEESITKQLQNVPKGLFKAGLDSTKVGTHPKLKGNRTDFLETLIPLIDGAKSLQFHLRLKEREIDRRFVNMIFSSFSGYLSVLFIIF